MLNLIKRLLGYKPIVHNFPCNAPEPEVQPEEHILVISEPVKSLYAALLITEDWDYSTCRGVNGNWSTTCTYRHKSTCLEVTFYQSWYRSEHDCFLTWATKDEKVVLCEAHKLASKFREEKRQLQLEMERAAEREKFMVFVTGAAA